MGRYEVPIGIEIAAAWSWRLILIAVAGYGLLWLAARFSEVSVPVAVALLGTALLIGAVDRMQRWGVPRGLGSLIALAGLLVAVVAAFTLVGQQLSTQFEELRDSVVEGIGQVQVWAKEGPLNLSDRQLADAIERLQELIASSDSAWLNQATEVGTRVGHFVAGFFIALFAMYFFMYEGDRIWAWLVGFFPKGSRARVASSGGAAWISLTAFVRATVLVALVDAIGIALVAVILDVPLAAAIGVLVFLGAFIPIVGALISGMVAVLVALVAHGPLTALLMLAGVIAVQQIESHVLQPFLMGRIVRIHPLAIILAIATGLVAAGIVGALLAVPVAAALNSVVKHLTNSDPDPILGALVEPDPPGDGSPQ